jgi:hypothetical protein
LGKFGWSGEHWHRFRVHGKDYGMADLGGISFDDDPHQVPLLRFRLHPRESFRYEYDFTANWRVDLRLEEIQPQDQRVVPVWVGGRAAAPGEEYAGALGYLHRLDRHRHEFPLEALGKMAEAIGRWLEAGGGRPALGDLKELRQAAERVSEYQEFFRRSNILMLGLAATQLQREIDHDIAVDDVSHRGLECSIPRCAQPVHVRHAVREVVAVGHIPKIGMIPDGLGSFCRGFRGHMHLDSRAFTESHVLKGFEDVLLIFRCNRHRVCR